MKDHTLEDCLGEKTPTVSPPSLHRTDLLTRLVGTSIGGYSIKGLLEETKHGGVFRAEHPRLERFVALKVLLPDAPDGMKHKFVNEGRRLVEVGKHNHPSIVAVHDSGLDKGMPYLVMQLIEGKDLKNLIEGKERFNDARIAHVLEDIGRALHYCHAYGVHHEDIKPSNIMKMKEPAGVVTSTHGRSALTRDELFVLVDFGGREHVKNDLGAIGEVADFLAKGSDHTLSPNLAHIVTRARREQYKRPAHLLEDIEDYHQEVDIARKHHKKVTRRTVLKTAAGVAITGLTGWGGWKGYTSLTSARRCVDRLAGMYIGDTAFDECAADVRRKLFEQKVKWIASKIPPNKFPFATQYHEDRWRWDAIETIDGIQGYWPRILLEGAKVTGDKEFRSLANTWLDHITLSPQDSLGTHATRFNFSHAHAYSMFGGEYHKKVALQALECIVNKYSKEAGFVITVPTARMTDVDIGATSRMVSFLQWGFDVSKNESYRDIARSLVQKAREFHIRENGSVASTISFDPQSYRKTQENNMKGLGLGSTFTRGQAQMFALLIDHLPYTSDPEVERDMYRVADYLVLRTRPDGIFPADLDGLHVPGMPPDTSTNTIAAPKFKRLYAISGNKQYRDAYRTSEQAIARSFLCSDHSSEGIVLGACENLLLQRYVGSSLILGDCNYLVNQDNRD